MCVFQVCEHHDQIIRVQLAETHSWFSSRRSRVWPIRWGTHTLTHSRTHARAHTHTHTHTHSLTHTLTLSHTHSLTRTHTQILIRGILGNSAVGVDSSAVCWCLVQSVASVFVLFSAPSGSRCGEATPVKCVAMAGKSEQRDEHRTLSLIERLCRTRASWLVRQMYGTRTSVWIRKKSRGEQLQFSQILQNSRRWNCAACGHLGSVHLRWRWTH